MKSYQALKRLFSITMVLCLCLTVLAIPGKKKEQKSKGDVGTTISLVTTGSGDTKDEATKNALRNALEQAYGAFVSSNSQVVNDDLVRDEIVSISTGNIVSYDVLSYVDSIPKQVTVNAVVSITRLQKYAQNKGMSAELAGNTFAMNLKMEELNKKNQDVAIKHLLEQTQIMAQNLFDYEILVGNPEKTPKGVQVPIALQIIANDNTLTYYDLFHKTLSSLAVEKRTGRDPHLYGEEGVEIPGWKQFDGNGIVYVLRHEPNDPEPSNTIWSIFNTLGDAVLNCEIVDNLGNVSSFEKDDKYYNDDHVTNDYAGTNELLCSQRLMGYRDGYLNGQRGFIIERLTKAGPDGVYFWMNAVKPHKGEILYGTILSLTYSVEEIGKISKIEVRPKYQSFNISSKLLGYNESYIDQNTEKGLNDSTKWEGRIYEDVEQMPSFPGGQGALMQYLARNIKYPVTAQENGVQGRVVVSFVVERDGSITDVQVVRSVDPSLDREAQRVVRSMPKWIPGKQNGQAVRVKFCVPVPFHLT